MTKDTHDCHNHDHWDHCDQDRRDHFPNFFLFFLNSNFEKYCDFFAYFENCVFFKIPYWPTLSTFEAKY